MLLEQVDKAVGEANGQPLNATIFYLVDNQGEETMVATCEDRPDNAKLYRGTFPGLKPMYTSDRGKLVDWYRLVPPCQLSWLGCNLYF